MKKFKDLFTIEDVLKSTEKRRLELTKKISLEKSEPRKQRLQDQLKQIDDHIAHLKKRLK